MVKLIEIFVIFAFDHIISWSEKASKYKKTIKRKQNITYSAKTVTLSYLHVDWEAENCELSVIRSSKNLEYFRISGDNIILKIYMRTNPSKYKKFNKNHKMVLFLPLDKYLIDHSKWCTLHWCWTFLI